MRQQAISHAVSQTVESERIRQECILRRAKAQQEFSLGICSATRQWADVTEIVDGELEFIASNRETLSVLGSSLDFFEAQLGVLLCSATA